MKLKVIVMVLLAALFVSSFACNYSAKLSKGNEVIAKIESFRKENGRLPNSLSEIGIEETKNGPIYYRKESESKYIIWFGKVLGESATYDSETKKWSNL